MQKMHDRTPPADRGRAGQQAASRGRQTATAGGARAGGAGWPQGQGAGYRGTPAGQRARAGVAHVLRPLIASYRHFYFIMAEMPTGARKTP